MECQLRWRVSRCQGHKHFPQIRGRRARALRFWSPRKTKETSMRHPSWWSSNLLVTTTSTPTSKVSFRIKPVPLLWSNKWKTVVKLEAKTQQLWQAKDSKRSTFVGSHRSRRDFTESTTTSSTPRNAAPFCRQTQKPIYSWKTWENILTISKNSFTSRKIKRYQLWRNRRGLRLLIVDGYNDILETSIKKFINKEKYNLMVGHIISY